MEPNDFIIPINNGELSRRVLIHEMNDKCLYKTGSTLKLKKCLKSSFSLVLKPKTSTLNMKTILQYYGIVKIMITLGWTEKGEQKSDDTYIIDEEINIPEVKGFEYYFVNYKYKKKKIMEADNSMPNQTVLNVTILNTFDK
ncbi:hypothetical protein PIROE2DRAFT_9714 [Piromyces sp. E2]|nr:hypothetical protein PIROE2DRAFT_9714 [Piromyces sp. E2]|eukprot:OUM63704.1 hypothetical protein PIROE2DRAFT_9714 [Piromyces sp. E2]